MPAFAPTAAAYKRVEHQKIEKSAKGAKLEIAADEIAQIIAGVVAGIAGVAHFAGLAGSLKVGFANESANETIDKTFVDEDTLTLAVLQLTKTMTRGSALLLCPCNASAYKISVHGEVTVTIGRSATVSGQDAAQPRFPAAPRRVCTRLLNFAMGMLAATGALGLRALSRTRMARLRMRYAELTLLTSEPLTMPCWPRMAPS